MYKFKEIQTVPPADSLIDVVLSKTNRNTPTVVHPGYKITRIRNFYLYVVLRKIKFVQSEYSERLTKMMSEFPRLDEIHPFFADLCNVLYDRDHFKLALGQISTTKNIIDNCAKDYVRMLKFADSLYRCKMLKRAALGRMCTAIKKLDAPLKFLEEVRQHLSRLPAVNPTTRTLILTGFPNVGKSSFMNTVTKANVDVQPYSFTTKSIFVGHMDYQYTRWQVLDTPGILDKPLEERNVIEMTAITALAHIQATILYFFDLSETCGYTIAQQVSLFKEIRPMFRNRPLLVLLNKSDLRRVEELSEEERRLIEECKKRDADEEGETIFLTTSSESKEGIDMAREKACQLLLAKRVDAKISQGSKVERVANRITVVEPQLKNTPGAKPMAAARPAFIPESVLKKRALEAAGVTGGEKATPEEKGFKNEKELQEEMGGAGVYSVDFNKSFLLAKDEWKYDEAPMIMDGANIADFIDTGIVEKLAKLEQIERAELLAEGLDDTEEVLGNWQETEQELAKMHSAIRTKQLINRDKKTMNKMGQNVQERRKLRSLKEVTEQLKEIVPATDLGKKASSSRKVEEAINLSARVKKRKRSVSSAPLVRGRSRNARAERESKGMDVDEGAAASSKGRKKSVSMSRARGQSMAMTASLRVKGLSVRTERSASRIAQSLGRDPKLQEKAEAKRRKLIKSKTRREARKGEGDRTIEDWKPKHLYSGKRGAGKTDRR